MAKRKQAAAEVEEWTGEKRDALYAALAKGDLAGVRALLERTPHVRHADLSPRDRKALEALDRMLVESGQLGKEVAAMAAADVPGIGVVGRFLLREMNNIGAEALASGMEVFLGRYRRRVDGMLRSLREDGRTGTMIHIVHAGHAAFTRDERAVQQAYLDALARATGEAPCEPPSMADDMALRHVWQTGVDEWRKKARAAKAARPAKMTKSKTQLPPGDFQHLLPGGFGAEAMQEPAVEERILGDKALWKEFDGFLRREIAGNEDEVLRWFVAICRRYADGCMRNRGTLPALDPVHRLFPKAVAAFALAGGSRFLEAMEAEKRLHHWSVWGQAAKTYNKALLEDRGFDAALKTLRERVAATDHLQRRDEVRRTGHRPFGYLLLESLPHDAASLDPLFGVCFREYGYRREVLEGLATEPKIRTMSEKDFAKTRANLAKWERQWDSHVPPQRATVDRHVDTPEFADLVAARLVACLEGDEEQDIDFAFKIAIENPARLGADRDRFVELTARGLWHRKIAEARLAVHRLEAVAQRGHGEPARVVEALEEAFSLSDATMWRQAARAILNLRERFGPLPLANPERVRELVERDPKKHGAIFKGLEWFSKEMS